MSCFIAPAGAQTDKGPQRVRNVYIPQDELETIFGEGAKGALLTRDEFNALWAKAAGELPEAPPVDAVLTRSRYVADLAEHELHITAHVQLVKLGSAWQSVELRFGGVAIESAKIDGQPAPLGRNPDGCLVWILHDKGRHELLLELSVPLVRTGGDLTAWLQLPPLPSSEFLLQVPDGKQVRVGGVEVKSSTAAEGRRTFRVPIDQSGQVPLAILDSAGGSHRVPLVFVSTEMRGTVEPSGLRWVADVSLDVAAQAADKFHLTLPRSVEVAGVESPDLARWTITERDGDRWDLSIDFRQTFQGQRRVRVSGLAPIQPGEPWSMPALSVVDAVSHVGEITVEPAATLRLEISEMKEIRRLPASNARTPMASVPKPGAVSPSAGPASARLHFAFWNERFVLRLLSAPRQRELAVAVASLVDVDRTGLVLRSSLTVEPRYAPLFNVTLRMPREWTIVALDVAGKPVAWEVTDLRSDAKQGEDQGGAGAGRGPTELTTKSIRFELERGVTPGNTITIALVAELHPPKWLEPEGEYSTVALPEVRLLGASEVEGTLIVESPRELELRASELAPDLEPIPPPPGPTSADVGTALAYRHQDDAVVTGRIEARLKPAQISVETLTFASLDRESLAIHYQADIQIAAGQARSFDFTLPAIAGEKIQVTPVNQPVRVIEQQHTAVTDGPQDKEEQFLWHIVLDRPVTGQLLLTISFELRRGNGETKDEPQKTAENSLGSTDGQTPAQTSTQRASAQNSLVPVLAFRNVARQTGYIAVEAATDQEVEQQATNLREVDPADLPLPIRYQPGRIVAAYQYQRLPFRLMLLGDRRESREVLAGVCDRATITSVLSREGVMRHQARYELRSLGVQHLTVQLPTGSTLWSVALDGTPVEVRRLGGKNIIPLPAGGPNRAAGQHTVDLLYETQVSPSAGQSTIATEPSPTSETNGNTTRSAPIAASGPITPLNRLIPQTIRQAAPVVNMTVLKLDWNVHLPNGTVLVASDGDFKPTVEPTRPSLIARLGDEIALNSVQDLGVKFTLFAAAVVFGGIMWMLAQSRSIVAAVVTLGVVSVVIAVLIPVYYGAYSRSARSATKYAAKNNMRQIGLAMSNYRDRYAESDGLASTAPGSESKLYPGYPSPVGARGAMGSRDDEFGGAIPTSPATVPAPLAKSGDFDRLPAERSSHEGGAQFLNSGGAMANGALSSRLSGGVNVPATSTPAAASPIQGMYSELGRLSLSMNLESRGQQGVQFTREGGVGELVMHVQDDSLARTLQWAVTVTVALVAWLMRKFSWSLRLGVAALSLLVPIGLSGLLPLAWTLLLDGLFVGGVIALMLWAIDAIVRTISARFPIWTAKNPITGIGTAATTALILIALASSTPAQGQNSEPKAKSATSKKKRDSSAVTVAQVPQGEISAAEKPPALPIDSKPFTLYVPYDPKKGDPRDSRWVYVPYEAFQRLWKLAHPENLIEPAPGVAAMVTEVGYEGRLDDDVARFDGRIVVYSFQDKWTRVALPLGTVALEKVELDGQPATLEEKADEPPAGGGRNAETASPSSTDRLAIYVEKAGLHVVDVRFSVPATRLGATGRLTMPLRPATAGRLRFELPGPSLDVQVEGTTGGWRIEAVATDDSESKIKNEILSVPIGGAGELTIRWQPRRGDLPVTQLISVDQTVLVDIKDSGIHLRSQLHYRVPQGSVRKLELRVPAQLAVRSVSGTDVADWSLVHGPADETAAGNERLGERRLEIALKAELRTATDIDIDAFLLGQEPLGSVGVRTIEPLAVSRETGRIVIGCTGQFHVRIGTASNLAQIERDGVQVPGGADAACDLLSAYRYTARPWSLELAIERLKPRVLVSGRTVVIVAHDRAMIHALLEATIGDSPLGSFRVQMPSGLRISRVTVPPGADWFVDRNSDEMQLRIELEQPTTGRVPVEVIGTFARDMSEPLFRVPLVSMGDASPQTGQLAVVLDQDTEGHQVDSGGARPIAPSELTGLLQQFATAPRVFAYQYNAFPQGLTLGLNTAASELAADVVSTVSVREGSVAYLSEIGFDIRGSARSRIQFTAPDWLGSDLDVQGTGIRQVQSEADSAGLRTWTVILQQAVRGKYSLRLVQSLPLPADSMIRAAIFRPLEAEPVRSYVLLENRSLSQLTELGVQGVSPIAPSEIPLSLNDELRRRAISAHKISAVEARLVWRREQHEQEKAIAASVNLADLVTVIHRDGTYRTQAAYIVTNRTRQFLEFALPPGSQLWAVYVAGQPVRPAGARRGQRDVTLVPLQKVSVGDISTQVVVVFAGTLSGKIGRWTQVAPPAPELLGGVPVARTLWTVYTPDDYSSDLVERASNMTAVAAGDLVVARDLAFFEEMNELVKVCKFSSSYNANMVACGNLRQISGVLQSFQRPAAPSESPAALDNRQRWRAADPAALSKNLEVFLCPSDRSGGFIQLGEVKAKDDWGVVQQRARDLQREIAGIVMNQPAEAAHGLDRGELETEHYFSESMPGLTDTNGAAVLPYYDAPAKSGAKEVEAQSERDTRRGKLREQNFANVDKLKEEQSKTRALQSAEVPSNALALESRTPFRTGGFASEGAQRATGSVLQEAYQYSRPAVGGGQIGGGGTIQGPAAPADGAGARAGVQSIEIEIPLVGKPHYFMRLLGEPKLTLTARHHDITRWSASAVWAALCLTSAGVLSYLFTQARVSTWLRQGWPWLGIVLGSAWLFLLPLGYVGCVLIGLGASVIAWRTRYPRMVQTKTI